MERSSDRVLGGLGFEFAGGADEGQQGDVDVGQVVATHVLPEFTDGFEEGQCSMSPTVPPISVITTSALLLEEPGGCARGSRR